MMILDTSDGSKTCAWTKDAKRAPGQKKQVNKGVSCDLSRGGMGTQTLASHKTTESVVAPPLQRIYEYMMPNWIIPVTSNGFRLVSASAYFVEAFPPREETPRPRRRRRRSVRRKQTIVKA
jgi:hypothetical protein